MFDYIISHRPQLSAQAVNPPTHGKLVRARKKDSLNQKIILEFDKLNHQSIRLNSQLRVQRIDNMVTKSRLKMALAADKKIDFQKLHQKKVAKLARKGKVEKGGEKSEKSEKREKKGKVEQEWEDVEEESQDEDSEEGDSEDEEEEEDEEGNGPTEVLICTFASVISWY